METFENVKKPSKLVQAGLMFLAIIFFIVFIFLGVLAAPYIIGSLNIEDPNWNAFLFVISLMLSLAFPFWFIDWADRKCGGRGLEIGG